MSFSLQRNASAAMLLAVVAACDTPLQPDLLPQARLGDAGTTIAGQLIVFASSRDAGLFQTFVMTANGTKVTQLTNQPFYNARPDWSHDGSRIAFTACRVGDNSCEIYVMNANGSAQTNITKNFTTEHMSVWSPDDRRIAFASDRDGNMEIYVMNADGSNPVRLTYNDATDQYPGWSPDGRKITFETDRDGNSEIYVMNADGSSPINLTRHPGGDVRPRWSPGGNKIAFDSDRDGSQQIYVMRSDGSRQTRLTRNPGTAYGAAWSPDADKIAFATDRDGNFEIYSMNADGSRQTRLTNDPAGDADPRWTTTSVRMPREPDLAGCVSSGTQDDINARLLHPGDVALLCAGAVFELTSPVVFTADGQQVYTEGFPTDDGRARLRLAASSNTAVVMLSRSNTVLSNVIVDGNQPNLGLAGGEGLIFAGGTASGQVIRNVKAFDTRNGSLIDVFPGVPGAECTNALVENNEIGPSRTEGGIALACNKSVVRNNTITDVSAVGIWVYPSPGSLVEGNVIRAETRMLSSGISMVDFDPNGGNHTGTRVHANVIDAAGAFIRVAVAMGYRIWRCVDPNDPTDYTLFGATVTDNILQGAYMQYGFAVDGVRDWTVTGNQDFATHSGTPFAACNGQATSPPAGFQFYRPRAQGIFQPEFADAFLVFAGGSIFD